MALTERFSAERENAAIDMMVSMVAQELSDTLGCSVEEIMPRFLQSKACATLYNRDTKRWWDGPSDIACQYLAEIGMNENKGDPLS